jgi:hypothetical protein
LCQRDGFKDRVIESFSSAHHGRESAIGRAMAIAFAKAGARIEKKGLVRLQPVS